MKKSLIMLFSVILLFSQTSCSHFNVTLPAILFAETDHARSLLEKNYSIEHIEEAREATIEAQINTVLSTWFTGFDIFVPGNSVPIMFAPKDSLEESKMIGGTMLEIDGQIVAYRAYVSRYPDVRSVLSDIGEVVGVSLKQPQYLKPCEHGADEYSTNLFFDYGEFALQIICLTENETDPDWKNWRPLRFLVCSKELCYSEIGDDFNSDNYKYTSLDYLKCDYLSQLIKTELLSDTGAYASIYDDAEITDCCGNWYELRFSAEVYQALSRLTDKVICYAWAYCDFEFEDGELVGVQYETIEPFFSPIYDIYRLTDERFTYVEIQDCRNRIGWGIPISRDVSSEVSLWGTVRSGEYNTSFELDEPVLIQIGEKQHDIRSIDIEDPFLFPTMISGKPISEFDGEHLLLTGTITSTSEDFSLVKFYTLRESVIGEDLPYSDFSADYETEAIGHVRYNEENDQCYIVLNVPTELTTINGHTALADKVRVWPVDYNFANDSIMNYIGQTVQVQGLVDYEFGEFTIRPTAITTSIDLPQQDLEVMYNNALDAVDTYLACCGEISPYTERNSTGADAYMLAKSNLLACGDYEQAQYWLDCINAIEDLCVSARDANMIISNGVSSTPAPALRGFSVSVSDNLITIQNDNLYSGEGTDLTLSYSFDQASFTATISPVYNDHMKGVDGEALRVVVALFTKIYNDEDLMCSLVESFSDDEAGKSVALDWGGYRLEIVTAGEYNYSRSIVVTGTRGN